jgi:hypothetical protein
VIKTDMVDAARASASPLSTGVRPLTHRQIFISSHVKTLAQKNLMLQATEYPIWYCGNQAPPYVAVNEAEHATSRRFGRDSFQTRSTR